MNINEIENISMKNLIKVGIKVKSQRSLRNLSQDELAELSGVNKFTIGRIENPNKYHNCELLPILKLAAALEISPHKFFDFSDLE
ncbi:MAG: helix-turn-helix transcriptional regulator [Defluviitaleaceae bacterium]|nr:helix-turn-helix transcriptional regulator [Defluviitaleaceae bacterium]